MYWTSRPKTVFWCICIYSYRVSYRIQFFCVQNVVYVMLAEQLNHLTAKLCFSTAQKSGNISSHTGKLFSSDTRQSMKHRIVTERLSKI